MDQHSGSDDTHRYLMITAADEKAGMFKRTK